MLIGIPLDHAVDVASRHAATPDAARTANDILDQFTLSSY